MHQIEPEQHHSIAEQIVPAKTKRSGRVKQYNSKKIHKWGFKNMVCAGRSGIIYDFFMNGGKHSTGTYKCGAENLVLRLVQNIPKHQNYQVFFDNWFSTFPLLLKLQSMGILATATFRMNRLAGCPLMSDKDFKKEGHWSVDYRTNMNLMLHVVKWHDNKAVTVASTFGGVGASSTKKRWDAKSKDHVDVSYPDMIRDSNQSMGGVDLSDMLIALYHVDIQTRKRWYLKIITHCLNICNVNAWLLY